jgi:hypothetical protein
MNGIFLGHVKLWAEHRAHRRTLLDILASSFSGAKAKTLNFNAAHSM